MGKYDGYLICSDFDGTLTNSNGEISAENMTAIKYFQDNGGLFTIATGRFPNHISKFSKFFIPNTFVIAVNGTMIYDIENDKILYSSYLDESSVKVLDYIDKQFDFVEGIHICSAFESFCYKKDNKEKLTEIYSKAQRPWHKFIFCQEAEDTIALKKDLVQKFGHLYNFNRSWPRGLEMHSKESGKGKCVLGLKKLLNREVHTTICVGDFENDISMIEIADIGYAVENALEPVKKSADRITVSNNENAIAHIIYEL